MMYHMSHSLPQCFISSVFALLMKKFGCDTRLDEFRAQIIIWMKWDLVTCLINFRPVLGRMLEFSRLIEDEEIQRAISVLVHADILCICAQFAGILLDPNTSKDLLKAQDDHAQKLLDLLQDLLDYPRLDSQIRPVLLRGLLKLSKKFKQHPRCFALPDLQLGGDPVAAGDFGDIWKSQFHNETVCVKVMRVYQKSDINTLLKEVYHEALIWRQLAHPNLLPFFGVYFLQNNRSRLCLVSPWLENGNISVYLKRHPVGSNRLTLVLDVALGLEYLHSLKFVHGDLKGLNVLVTDSGWAVLADFGLSSVVMDSKILVLSASTVKTGGTTRWQAPEILEGDRTSPASDVYAFACVCYEIFTGTVPFPKLNNVAVIRRVVQGERPTKSSSILDYVWTLMMECWKAEPQERPS
ncbi:kinase-like domain-containing protein, partial [Mycena leptocephala]